MRLITDPPRNKDVCIVDGMFPVHFHVDLPSTFGGQVNVTLSCLVRCANHVDFACVTLLNIHQLMILPEKIMV